MVVKNNTTNALRENDKTILRTIIENRIISFTGFMLPYVFLLIWRYGIAKKPKIRDNE